MSEIFDSLRSHYAEHKSRKIVDLFKSDTNRFSNFSLSFEDIVFDYSKTNISDETLSLLLSLVDQVDLPKHRTSLFAGDPINTTENRSVEHMLYRTPDFPQSHHDLFAFADSIRQSGKFTDIVHIGIGGSHLGPAMAIRALGSFCDGPNIHFVSNIDAHALSSALESLDATKTLFIVASKTFKTSETMTNAHSAKDWFLSQTGSDSITDNFVAISSNHHEAEKFGISKQHIFDIPESVGGRFSVWSSIGLPILLSIGTDNFRDFLLGGHSIDTHFCNESPKSNLPILQALISIWHHTICGYPSNACLPYDERLSLFPSYLQQLSMESNGKSVSVDGIELSHSTAPIIWGDVGTRGQHAFHQLLHQGSIIVPTDFFISASPSYSLGDHHAHLVSNAFAQSESLMVGSIDSSHPHKNFTGNRPSVTYLYRDLTPYLLGQLIATFEHKIFVEGVILGINSFDQWGVELGKSLSRALLPSIKDSSQSVSDYTSGILATYHNMSHNDD